MKSLSTFTIVGIMILSILTFSSQNNFAQTTIDVPQGVGTLEEAVAADTDPNGSIFRLERGGYYVLQNGLGIIVNGSATLRLIAEDGDGNKPVIIPGKLDDGRPGIFINETPGGFDLKNIYLSGINFEGVRALKNMIRSSGDGLTFRIDSCYLQSDYQAPIRTNGTNQKWFVTNTIFGNAVTNSATNPWDGIHFAARNEQDTLWFENCTFFLNSNRVLDSYGKFKNFVGFNHCTFAQSSPHPYASTIDFNLTVDITFTNNLVIDHSVGGLYQGDIETTGIIPFRPLPPDNEVATDADRKITIANNVYGWSQKVKDYLASKSGSEVQSVPFIDDSTQSFASQYDNMVIENNIEESVVFTDPTDIDLFIQYAGELLDDAINSTENATTIIYQDRNGTASISEDITTFGPADDDYDFSYSTSAAAYTAALGKWPAGDLNWFPDVLADWLADPTDVDEVAELPVDFSLEQNYPNPFNPSTTIKYNLPGESKVSLEVFDVLGSKVASLINGKNQHAGSYEVKFDASQLSSGIYFYRLSADNLVLSKKMILLK